MRIAITSKGKGKSGGARIITYLQIEETTVYLIAIYDKSEQANISDSEIKKLLEDIWFLFIETSFQNHSLQTLYQRL